ncbi:MAG: putative 4-hydroxybenzoate polyprenyltransferase [bacterium]|nr:putative 4-hydroxybenzoate polyprenyltransferase [bacterium]
MDSSKVTSHKLQAKSFREKIRIYSELTLFPFVIFTLPFALAGAALAQYSINGRLIPSITNIFWIILAVVSARNAGMAVNRLLDKDIDGKNPRTKERALVKGVIRDNEVIIFTVFSLVLFILSAWMLNPLCLYLSPIPIALILVYSSAKRWTWLNHFLLGAILFWAPVGGWIAVKGEWNLSAMVMGLAVFFWTSGFDIIYDREDIEFYRTHGLHSIPELLGEKKSQIIAFGLHIISISLLLYLAKIYSFRNIYFIGILTLGVLVIYGHIATQKTEILRTNKTFFLINALTATGFLFITLSDLIIR